MTELTLDEIRACEFEALKYLRDVCESRGLEYFLSNGTLLGAIKYKGFIPWDDDIDVFMPRKDYDRLIAEFENNDRYALISRERVDGLYIPFAKLSDLSTYKDEKLGDSVRHGLDIDIFPLDNWYDDEKKARAQCRGQFRRVHTLILANSYRPKGWSIRETAKRLIKLGGRAVGRKRICDRLIKSAKANADINSKHMGCVCWCIYGEKEIIPSECFSDTVTVKFENEMFKAPVGYDKYLRMLYGKYEIDPPLSEQRTHHIFKAYKL